jgi:hypothetical protein
MGVGGQCHAPAALLLERAVVPIAGGWMGPTAGMVGFWQIGNSFPQPGIKPRSVQPVASRYSEYAIWPPGVLSRKNQIMQQNLSLCKSRTHSNTTADEQLLPFLTSAVDGELSTSRPGCFTRRKEPRYPLNRRPDKPQDWSGRFREAIKSLGPEGI